MIASGKQIVQKSFPVNLRYFCLEGLMYQAVENKQEKA